MWYTRGEVSLPRAEDFWRGPIERSGRENAFARDEAFGGVEEDPRRIYDRPTPITVRFSTTAYGGESTILLGRRRK